MHNLVTLWELSPSQYKPFIIICTIQANLAQCAGLPENSVVLTELSS